MLNMLTWLILEQYEFGLCRVTYLRILSNKYVEKVVSGIFVLLLILGGTFSAFQYWVCCSSYMAFIMLRCIPSMPTFWNFYHKQMLIFFQIFASIEMIIWVVFFNLLMLCIILIYLQTLKNPWIPGINPTQSVYELLMYCLIWFANILFRISAYTFISYIGL